MKKILLFSILFYAVLLSGACKSNAASRTTAQSNIQSGSTSTPSVTQSSSTITPSDSTSTPAVTQPSQTTIPSGSTSTPVATQPSQTTISPVSQPSGVVGTGIGSRHQSGIILDGAVSYTVKRRDTLTSIARQFYQDGSYYPLIMMVSSGISDIDKIYPNMRLTIPDLRTNMNDPTAKESINRYFLQIANLEDQRGRSRTAALIRNHAR